MITKRHSDFSHEEVNGTRKTGRAAFFDRDGTINVDFGHVYRREDLVFVDGIPEIIRYFNGAGIPVIVVTNQAGIAKGLYQERDMHQFHRYMNQRLCSEYGAHIDAFYFCPHHPEMRCSCRKPEPGMLKKAARDWRISLADSVMFGDRESDRLAAERAGIGTFYLVEDENPEYGFQKSVRNGGACT